MSLPSPSPAHFDVGLLSPNQNSNQNQALLNLVQTLRLEAASLRSQLAEAQRSTLESSTRTAMLIALRLF